MAPGRSTAVLTSSRVGAVMLVGGEVSCCWASAVRGGGDCVLGTVGNL
jgi:hypothetical protein